ncbi:MAG: V-type ATPase 116kDa subunit family protein [Erysipelotrichaceae bacterium]|nr:V-type ATPase 116kDa subunit family protein [Erysipelotrichaceae bacterium]
MAITKMKVVTLSTESQGYDQMLNLLGTCDNFHVEEARNVLDTARQGKVYEQDTRYMEALTRMESVMRSLHIELPAQQGYVKEVPIDEIETKLQMVEERFETVNNQLMSMSHLKKEDMIAISALREYDFEEMNHSQYVSVNFGRLPIQSMEKLQNMANDKIVVTTLHSNKQYHWILCVCLWADQMEMDELFESLYFEPIAIPAIDDQKVVAECKEILSTIYGYVKFRGSIQKMNRYVAVYGTRFEVKGFVPANEAESLIEKFRAIPTMEITCVDPLPTDPIKPPTKLKNNIVSRPFDMFIEMYGMPGYFDFDPTTLLGITYSLLFGIMFGDFGQGLVLIILSAIIWKKNKMKLAGIGMRIGVFSMIFGLFYGSFFGNEELIGEWMMKLGIPFKPFHTMSSANIMPLLLAAVGLGAMLILISIFVNIVNKLHKKEYGEAIFHQNGVAGFIFYGSIMVGIVLQMGFGIPVMKPALMIIFLGIPMVMILLQHPFQNLVAGKGFAPHEKWGSYLMTSVFEVLEVMLSFVSNTMSFMRVGGFVLSHAGMMLVVMTLHGMASGGASLLIMIIGNVIVMALEGLVVGIQTLRLEYYEMFSRYFEATGHKFEPVSMKN